MSVLRDTNKELDVYQLMTDSVLPGYDVPASTADPFDPYDVTLWWRRWRALVPAYQYDVTGGLRDTLFGSIRGDFVCSLFERGLLSVLGAPHVDTDFAWRWMIRDLATGKSWLVYWDPRVLDNPLGHIECYGWELDPSPVNRD